MHNVRRNPTIHGKVDQRKARIIQEKDKLKNMNEHGPEVEVPSSDQVSRNLTYKDLMGRFNVEPIGVKEAEKKETKRTPFGYIQPVIRIPEEQLVPDKELPSTDNTGSLPFRPGEFAVQVVDSVGGEGDGHMLATNKSGRQLFSEPTYDMEVEGRHLTSVMVKSTGMAEITRRSWRSYQGQEEPFFYCEHVEDDWADTRSGITGSDGYLGLALREDQTLDAEKSVQLHKAGVRTRLPLSGWRVEALRVGGKWRDIEWFKSQGFEGEELYQSAWGITCPLRLQDINDFLMEAVLVENDPDRLDPLLYELVQLAKKDNSQPYQDLVKEWGEITGELSDSQRVQLWTAFGVALSQTMGCNFEALTQAGLSHSNIHDQNITFFGELCDNSEAREGKLVAGVSQKKGDDLMSFAGVDELSGIRKYASLMLYMEGKDGASVADIDELVGKTYFPAVRQEWTSYESWIRDSVQSVVTDEETREKARVELADIYTGQSYMTITEEMITHKILKDTGIEKRYKMYG